ncbi:FadR/GntR family transcriptional regulator [Streptomyces sp. NBC_00872]|uniref:FadR/GntR family transcriptional regulator n=1 Tax=Streptomyces sp. NBC_00872 TaxID=2903686 RepID=UPI003866CCCD|nr:FCD domain-containing protein [Streptomyces sp. NBC_00872]
MTPYARRGVHGQTVEILARRVLSGEIPEGATLDLVALQRELDVSLTALRESLKVLGAKGMVDARQRRGTFVRARADWNLLDADVLRWQFADGTSSEADLGLLRNLGEVRGIVEPAAVRLAAARRTDADLAELEAALTAMGGTTAYDEDGTDGTDGTGGAGAAGGAARAVEADLAFHRALLAATHNELLERMEMVIESGLAHRDQIVHSSPHGEDPVPSHRAVLDAVRARDQDAAERAMRALLDQAVRDLDRVHGAPHADTPRAETPHADTPRADTEEKGPEAK